MTLRTVRVVAALAVAVVALASCAPGPAPTPTPSAPFATEDEAFAAAEATYRAYVDALNQVDLSDPETFEPVYALTTGDANATERENLSRMSAEGWSVAGASLVTRVDSLSDSSESSISIGACVDVSAVTLLNSVGVSQVDPSRPVVQSVRADLAPSASSPTRLAIAKITGYELTPPCLG